MIKLNGKLVEVNHFADKTQKIKVEKYFGSEHKIEWKYEDDSELVTLIYLVRHIRTKDLNANISLDLWYIPNARMDRVQNDDEIFTLKYFAEIINSLCFRCIRVLDAHSNVSLGLIDRVENYNPKVYIQETLELIGEDVVIYFPDDGAAKRYKDIPCISEHSKIYGKKVRDWQTGEITKLEIVSDCNKSVADLIHGKIVLMIDDIISQGSTMYLGARELKSIGASGIFAFASHVENINLENGNGVMLWKALEEGLISRVYTTNSIYKGGFEKIKIIQGK